MALIARVQPIVHWLCAAGLLDLLVLHLPLLWRHGALLVNRRHCCLLMLRALRLHFADPLSTR
eukprot:COSAG06_NODE_63303_length_262_cov_1.576687_1_plen_62_part_10